MEKQQVVTKVLSAVGITDNQIDLVGTILDLEKDTKKVHSVELHYGTSQCRGISASIYLLSDFKDANEFKEYLTTHNLPIDYTSKTIYGDYFLRTDGVYASFGVPEIYPKK